MRLIQHKKEAWWFYRFLSIGYDRYVNPLFWTPRMRDQVLALAELDRHDLETVDVGAGTGFGTAGVVQLVDPERVTMLDQSPHQLARARRKPELAECRKLLGDAEALPLPDASVDRYVSFGSIEYWPEPRRGIAEALRVLRPGGVALVAGPVLPHQPLARALAQVWMLFPTEEEYRRWFAEAGFEDVGVVHVAPDWYEGGHPFALAIVGRKPRSDAVAPVLAPPVEKLPDPDPDPDPDPGSGLELSGLRRRALFAGRLVVGSLAGAAFVPLALVATLRSRLRRLATVTTRRA